MEDFTDYLINREDSIEYKNDSDKNVDSIEEDVKILKSYLDNFKYNVGSEIIKSNEIIKIIDYKEIKAIEHLLEDYTRQKQRNEEHQQINRTIKRKSKRIREI